MARDLSALQHITKQVRGGGAVIALDTGAIISSEGKAMLQALSSRSSKGFWSHWEILLRKGPEEFMADFYVGYGHKSIGDCGDAVVFIENVSMLVAKAIQDYAKYCGQEVSTRYVDFEKREFLDLLGSASSIALLDELRAFYVRGLGIMVDVLTERYPILEGDDPKEYKKAIKARAFDTMRSFLPAGASTNLAWYGTLRDFGDRLPVLRNHPLAEVRNVADAIEDALLEMYPSSFPAKENRYEATEAYLEEMGRHYTYYEDYMSPDCFMFEDSGMDYGILREFRTALEIRPPKVELPYAVRDAGVMRFEYPLDFASFRDVQRHRAVAIRMPLLTTKLGFEQWYLDEMPESLRNEGLELLARYELQLDSFELNKFERQYYIPMGYRVPIRQTGDLRAQTYLVELRATRFVHPTLRIKATKMADALRHHFGEYGLVLHLDQEPDRFDAKRGAHDIVLKE